MPHGRLMGYWSGVVGGLNEVQHLWEYGEKRRKPLETREFSSLCKVETEEEVYYHRHYIYGIMHLSLYPPGPLPPPGH